MKKKNKWKKLKIKPLPVEFQSDPDNEEMDLKFDNEYIDPFANDLLAKEEYQAYEENGIPIPAESKDIKLYLTLEDLLANIPKTTEEESLLSQLAINRYVHKLLKLSLQRTGEFNNEKNKD